MANFNFSPETISSNARMVGGTITTVTASDTVVTGLKKVIAGGAHLDSAPVLTCASAQGVIGTQTSAPASGSMLVKTWMPTATGDSTPTAATTFGKKVTWWALGY